MDVITLIYNKLQVSRFFSASIIKKGLFKTWIWTWLMPQSNWPSRGRLCNWAQLVKPRRIIPRLCRRTTKLLFDSGQFAADYYVSPGDAHKSLNSKLITLQIPNSKNLEMTISTWFWPYCQWFFPMILLLLQLDSTSLFIWWKMGKERDNTERD